MNFLRILEVCKNFIDYTDEIGNGKKNYRLLGRIQSEAEWLEGRTAWLASAWPRPDSWGARPAGPAFLLGFLWGRR